MVKLRPPTVTRGVVIKPARRRRSASLTREPVCIWPGCDANLARDHDSPVCGCHVKSTYNPHHDPHLPELIQHLVTAAYPRAVDLCAVLRCVSDDIRPSLDYLRRREISIVGARRGYVLELPRLNALRRGAGRGKVEA